jgi:hypothetical protein
MARQVDQAPDCLKEDGMEDKAKKCAHPACTCTVKKDAKYCSQYCQDAGGTMEIACNCGHAGCAIGEGAGAPTFTAQG